MHTDSKKENNQTDDFLVAKTFENYLILVGLRSNEYTYDEETLFNNIEYFRRCQKAGLSPYKALLFLYDYINGDYNI
jgi:hypothetical protein